MAVDYGVTFLQAYTQSLQPVLLTSGIEAISELNEKDTKDFVEAIISITDPEKQFDAIHLIFSKYSEEYLRQQLNFPNYDGVEKLLGVVSLSVNKKQLAILNTFVESMEAALQREINIKEALQNFTNEGDKGFQENAENLAAVLSVLKVRLAELSKAENVIPVSFLGIRDLVDQHQNGIRDTVRTPHEDLLAKIIVDFRQAFSYAGAIERALGKDDIFKVPKASVLTLAGETIRLFDMDKCFSPCYLTPTTEVANELENQGINPVSNVREVRPAALINVTARRHSSSSLSLPDRIDSSGSSVTFPSVSTISI